MNRIKKSKQGKASVVVDCPLKRQSTVFGVFSSIYDERKFVNKVDWKTLLTCRLTRKLIETLYNLSPIILDRFSRKLQKHFLKIERNSGLKHLCLALKAYERSTLLKRNVFHDSPLWISDSVFHQSDIPEEVTLIYLTLHRNMLC